MADIKEGLNNILQAINNLVEPKMQTLKYDKTFRGKVIDELSNGEYQVQINGKIYSLKYDGKLDKNQIVKVKAPLNNFSDAYIETVNNTDYIDKIVGVEFATNEYINKSRVYGKIFSDVSLPSAQGNITIDTELDNNINFVRLEGSIRDVEGDVNSNLPFIYTGQPEVYHYFNKNTGIITIRTTGNASAYYVVETLYYTKNEE